MTTQFVDPNQFNSLRYSESTSLVIVDPAVEDLQTLLRELNASHHDAFVLDPHTDGIEQVTQILQAHDVLPSSVYLVAHGSPATLSLGNAQLTLSNLQHYSQLLRTWAIENLYIYGCNVAAGDAGEEFLQKLHRLTQANLAASTQKIGSTQLGGTWQLDYHIGTCPAPSFVTPQLEVSYSGVLNNELTRIFTITEDNANNAAEFGNPDGDFGKGIRVGANFAVDTTVSPEENLGEIQPIEFYIPTDRDATIGSAFLFLSIFDVDAPEEKDLVTFNGTELGLLEGEDKLTFRTIFEIPNNLVSRNNFVEIDVDIENSQGPDENAWEAEIERATLIVNYIIGETAPGGAAFLDTIDTARDVYQGGETVEFTADIDTTLADQTLEIETILRDPNGRAVDFDDRGSSEEYPIIGTDDGDAFVWEPVLPEDALPGIWTIDMTVFDANTGEFQLIGRDTFTVGDGTGGGDGGTGGGDGGTGGGDGGTGGGDGGTGGGDGGTGGGDGGTGGGDGGTGGGDGGTGGGDGGTGGGDGGVVGPGLPPVPTGPLVFQFTDFVTFEALDDNLPYRGALGEFFGGPRPGVTFFSDEQLYLLANADVNAAVARGEFTSGFEHYQIFGEREGRNLLPLNIQVNGLRLANLFDETYYLDENPDVAAAVSPGNGGFSYGFEHFLKYGILEDRNPSLFFDAEYYRDNNPDVVAAAVDPSNPIRSSLFHYLFHGHLENRNPSTLFDANDYLVNNPDVAEAVEPTDGRFESAFDHYIEFGAGEGRVNTLLFEELYYLLTNDDVNAAVQAGDFQSGFEHYIIFGQGEGRDPAFLFDESEYLGANTDVENVIGEQFSSGMEHYFRFGRQEGRSAFAVPSEDIVVV